MQNFNSPLEAFLYWEIEAPNNIFFKQPIDGKIITFTFKEVGKEARKIASKLKSYGLPQGSHIALLSKNCAHWSIADLAIMMAGYVSIPIYPTLNAASINQILIHSESKAIIVGKLDDYTSQKEGVIDIPVISVGLYGNTDGELWEDIMFSQAPLKEMHIPKSEELITIIYTSGTTGNPKGVMHTVGNFMESTNTLIKLFKLPKHLRLFSYLPLAHVAERLIANSGMVLGATTSFAESLDTFAKDLERTQPHVFFAVPRIWTKFQDKILESLPQKKLNIILNIPILNKVVKNKLKQKLGLKSAVFICSAAAPISSSLIKWYRKLGITIYQGYGMTEDCCVSHFNLPENDKIGTVGKTLFNAQAKLSAEGEICIKNNCLMKGYYKSPEMTAEVFTEDGYLRTGDIGEYDHDGYLTITGRLKDQFKTDKGKYISPAPLELELSKNTDIEQICIVGTGIPQPIALITLSELGKSKDKSQLVSGLEATVAQVNPMFEKHEKIEKVVVMKEDWNVDNGLTTPTLKVKRNSIEKIHQQFYKSWFEMHAKVIFE
ncbi:AMP-binding protein [Pontimicrobium sp. IMCC45349]|uniref:AMP-binding protein n=1 Tax=Pontimicrobium sp. IMCC45349 TaxID=3391574 RepID=UPI0039A0FE3E